ncbi:hypothetical protein FBZ89_13519 [Nitrospirillum amazonense]|uniref:Uncharacterized protein n=1 Tax=Nitrospirillum amazonense TaxID=28077 RepID=A0A560ELJ0_9PROT|nr:hypothetical protein FBZ89_13519 [Nitrospirillum amazonense]
MWKAVLAGKAGRFPPPGPAPEPNSQIMASQKERRRMIAFRPPNVTIDRHGALVTALIGP